MKSYRKIILQTLATHGELTIDDMITHTGIERKPLSSNIGPTKADGLITSRRDDVTGLPAYKITDLGRQRLAAMVESSTPAASKPAAKTIEQRAVNIAVDRHNEADTLRARLKQAEKQRDDHFYRAESLQTALENLDKRLGIIGTMLINIDGDSIEDKLGKITHEHLHATQRLSDLEVAVDAAQQTIAKLEAESAEAIDVKDAASAFMVKAPGKKARICKKPENARNAALSGARQHGVARVFALVLVGKAVRGAEWKEVA